VGGRDHVEFIRPGQDLLQCDVRDRILDDDTGARLAFGNAAPWSSVDLHRAEELFRDLVAPITEGTLGELHDVSLVHKGRALPLGRDRVLDGAVDQAFRAEIADRLEADADLERHGSRWSPDAL